MNTKMMAILFKVLLIMSLMTSCLETPQGKRVGKGVATSSEDGSVTDTSSNPGGQFEAPTDGDLDAGDLINDGFPFGRPRLTNLVDPTDGTYTKKLSVPKNMSGVMYIAGLNLTGLRDKLIKVRFRFGRELEPVDVDAVIGRAPGLTPQTDVEVLTLDMSSKPFQNVRLFYDLFDYSDYRDGTGAENKSGNFTSPEADPTDTSLYCRGLRISDDPTFTDKDSPNNNICDRTDETCLYAYAKIVDSLLYNASGTTDVPFEPQIDLSGNGYTSDSQANDIAKCLPDNTDATNLDLVVNANSTGGNDPLIGNDTITLADGVTTMTYNGPFRTINEANWEITGDAVFTAVTSTQAATGIFQNTYTAGDASKGYKSFLFPRAGTLKLKKGIEYIGSSDFFETRSLLTLGSSGNTLFMDGCNIRATNFDSYTNEGISSCNVTATIELISTERDGSEKSLLVDTNGLPSPDRGLKLQLIRPSLEDFEGKEVLYQSIKTCSSNQVCGIDECCFNDRCWSKDLVSQCLDDVDNSGNLNVGESCTTDFQCSSLCCRPDTGTCQPHVNNAEEEEVLCSKNLGQSCVAETWCEKVNLRKCLIVKTGTDPLGQQQCALRCYNIPTYGQCKEGICIQPDAFAVPAFDANNPDCSTAVNPPQGLQEIP